MKKLIVVGHPASGYKQVEQWLVHHGMAQALPSRRQNLGPADINSTLCNAHDCQALSSTAESNDRLLVLNPGPVWNELALDLMLANTQHKLWGWADPQAIHLLDYWAGLEPGIRFVLVYANPETAFAGPDSSQVGEVSDDLLQADHERQCQQWIAFNHSLLHFYLRHPERSVLMHADTDSSGHVLRQLELLESADIGVDTTIKTVSDQPLAQRLLAQQLAQQYPGLQQCFNELQAAATAPALAQKTQASAAVIAQALQELHGKLSETLSPEEISELKEENELLLNQLHLVQEELESYYLKYQELKKQGGKTAQKRNRMAAVNESAQPNGFLGRAQVHVKAKIQARKIAASDLFDAQWYFDQNPDIARNKLFAKNPALHYLLHGGYEGRDPSPRFSNWSYLNRHRDIARAGFNPLLHYICHGKAEGRFMS